MRIMQALFGKSPSPPPELPTPDPLPDVHLDGQIDAQLARFDKAVRIKHHAHDIARREHVRLLTLPFEDIGRAMGSDKR